MDTSVRQDVICNMKMFLLKNIATVILLSSAFSASGQYDIKVDIKNYENDTLVVGYFYGDKQLVRDTLYSEKKGKFRLTGKDTLDAGIYMLLTHPDKEYVQFHVNEDNKEFEIEFDYKDKTKTKFKKSPDNNRFKEYIAMLTELRPRAQVLRDTINGMEERSEDATVFKTELEQIDQKVNSKQEELMTKYPQTLTAKILKANKEIEVPEFEDAEEPQSARYHYYKAHYFDNIDLGDPHSLTIGVLPGKLENYMKKLTSNHPDSITKSLDIILEKMEPAETTYRYYLSTYLNEYGKSKIIGYDAIYVHLVDNYYSDGKAPWVSEENLLKIVDNANKIRPSLIGKIGADLKVFGEDGKTTISISEIDYEYLVLLFWAPDCGHCTKMMPTFVEFNDKWKDSGVKVFAICTKHQDKTKNCWEKLEEKNMLGFINAADQYHRSRFKMKYNVSTTPKVFILNKDREILLKNLGADQLEDAFKELLRKDKKEHLIPKESKE